MSSNARLVTQPHLDCRTPTRPSPVLRESEREAENRPPPHNAQARDRHRAGSQEQVLRPLRVAEAAAPPSGSATGPRTSTRLRTGRHRSRTSEPKNSAQKSRAILRLTLISLKTQVNVREDTGIACHGHARRVSPRSRERRGRPRSAAKSSAVNASIGRALQPNRRFPSRSHSKAMAAVSLLETLPVFLSNI